MKVAESSGLLLHTPVSGEQEGEGAVAEGFKRGVSALAERGPSEEEFDEFIAGYTQLAQQPVVLH